QAGAVALPLHRVPPFSLQGALAASEGFDGMPFVQRSIVQPLPSTRTSVLSLIDHWAPPMQAFFLQSPPGVLLARVAFAVVVARRLVRQRGADRGVVDPALAVRARVGLAGRIGAAVGGGDAADAGARSVAH